MPSAPNPIYTHFKGKNLTRCELIERIVVETILKSKMPDKKRDWSKTFELKHSSSVTQWGRVLAQKRGLDPEHAAIVSRELNIPCLVNTKVSSKIFQNGDLVEIDPIHGTAKKI